MVQSISFHGILHALLLVFAAGAFENQGWKGGDV
jgi:hypothetical protein